MGQHHGEPARILLVDDDLKGLCALEATLSPLRQVLVRAASGREALRQLLHHDFAVILLDVMLPDMDGFETAKLIRERERTRQTPIVFITGIERAQLPELRAYAVGAVDYLLKPFDPDILRSKVSVFVDLHHKTVLARRQEEVLREAQAREHERALAEAARRLEMERALAREQVIREEMKALRLREGFYALASQELKAPLGALTRQLRSALDERGEVRTPLPRAEHLAQLRELEHHVHRLDVLVDNLLDLSRLDAGRLDLELARVDLAQVLREVAEGFEEELQRSGCALTLHAPPSLPGLWDRRRVEQVLTTLIAHALRRGAGHPVSLRLVLPESDGAVLIELRHAGTEPAALDEVLQGELPPSHAEPDALTLWLAHQLMGRLGGRLEVQHTGGRHGVLLRARLQGGVDNV
jgi:CheY-like chemotaxis protein